MVTMTYKQLNKLKKSIDTFWDEHFYELWNKPQMVSDNKLLKFSPLTWTMPISIQTNLIEMPLRDKITDILDGYEND